MNNSFTQKDVIELAESFKCCPNLHSLCLNNIHKMGDDGLIALCKALKHCPKLEKLGICDVGTHTAGSIAVLELIKATPTLRNVGFRRNEPDYISPKLRATRIVEM